MALLFESEICGRCGGSGQYSYNQRDGTRCFGCAGQKVRLTKRGAAAQAFFKSLLMRPVEELKVGDLVRGTGVTMGGGLYGFTSRVLEVDLERKVNAWHIVGEERIPIEHVSYSTKRGKHCVSPGDLIEIRNEEDVKAAREQALAYQASLTKAGKPMKKLQRA
jgi:hypothetical protein